jgi:hypothetical protein
MDRKEFFKESGRWIILSGIGLVTTLLALDHKIVRAEDCPETSQCRNCRKLRECNLPKAKQQLYGK